MARARIFGGTQDAFNYVYQPWVGDGQIIARVASLQVTDPWAKAGASCSANRSIPARLRFLAVVSATSGTALQYRANANDDAINLGGGVSLPPYWVKLVRAGNSFNAFSSVDGTTWNSLGSVSVNMTGTVYVGLAVTAHNNSAFAPPHHGRAIDRSRQPDRRRFHRRHDRRPVAHAVEASGSRQRRLPGNATYAGGVFNVTGSGADIWSTADALQFVEQPWTGNGSIIAKVTSVGSTDPWAKAGVMIRAGLTAGAAQAMTVLHALQRRRLPIPRHDRRLRGASHGGRRSAPKWVKLSRSGNVFTSYISSNGTTWTKIGVQSITMPRTIYIGLAVCAHNNTLLNTSTFSNVQVSANCDAG